MMNEKLEKAVAESKQLPAKPDNETLLELYSFYKQAKEGDAPEEGNYNMFDFVAKAKHTAWLKLKGMSSEDATDKYVALVDKLKQNT
ncbi:MAG: acyl-CoA-binding protein [Arachidicoccus sp.]|nr:acyl-CoA-binding protein [Arachidicoccus sp.]